MFTEILKDLRRFFSDTVGCYALLASPPRFFIVRRLAERGEASAGLLSDLTGVSNVNYHLGRLRGLVAGRGSKYKATLCGLAALSYYCSRRELACPPAGVAGALALGPYVMLAAAALIAVLSWFTGRPVMLCWSSPLDPFSSTALSMALILVSWLLLPGGCCAFFFAGYELAFCGVSLLSAPLGALLFLVFSTVARWAGVGCTLRRAFASSVIPLLSAAAMVVALRFILGPG